MGKCKGLCQDKFIVSFCTINYILRVKKARHVKPIIMTHHEDLWQFRHQDL